MKKLTPVLGLLLVLTSMQLSGCGGGGGGNPSVPNHQDTKLVMKVMTSGALTNGNLIGAIDLTVEVPGGVSVKATPDTQNPSILVTDAGVVVPSGAAAADSLLVATFAPPQGNAPGRLRILIVNANGFGTGEFATVTFDLERSGFPNTSEPVVLNFTASAQAGQAITSLLTPGYTAVLE